MKSLAPRTVLLAAAMALAPLTIALIPASAAPSCTAGKQTVIRSGEADPNRAYVDCSRISSTERVRPKLNRNLQSDVTGSWFTVTNTTRYTAYATCSYGCAGGYEWGQR